MRSIDTIIDLSLRSTVDGTRSVRSEQPANTQRSTRPIIRDDFVIPHVGSKISDEEVVDFAESIAESILSSPYRAVNAQANQREDEVDLLTE